MRKDDLINSIEPIIDEITELNKKIDNVKTIKGDTGEKGEQGEKGDKGETGETGIGYDSKEWTQGIHRQGQIVQHFIGQQYKALKDTDKEPPHEDWQRVGTNGFRWTGIKNDKTEYKDGDLFIDSGTTFLVVDGKAKMFAQRGRDGKHGQDGKDGKSAREFVHVKWTDDSISFVYDDGEIVEADIEGLTEIQKRLTFLDDMFSDYQNIDAPIKRYAGAYVPKNSYAKGDTASNAKSLYLCVKDDPNSSSLDPEKWIVLCNAQGGGGGSKGEYLPLAGGTMTGIIGSISGELMRLKSSIPQVITCVEDTSGLAVDLRPTKTSTFEINADNQKALSVDGKKIIEASKEQDDELVKVNASNWFLTTRKYVVDLHEKNYQRIIDLEEEIDAIAPASARGTWEVAEPTSINRPPVREGTFYLMDASDVNNIVFSRDLTKANSMIISDVDANGALHSWTYAKVGDHIEILRTGSPDYMVGKITTRQINANGYVTYTYAIESSMGDLDGDTVEARVKIYNLETGILLESLMPKSGGTFTGNVYTNQGNLHVIGNNSASSSNFSVKNRYEFTHLNLNGYGNFEYDKSQLESTRVTNKTVATMGDVNNNVLYTLGSSDNMSYRSPKSLSNYEFATDRNSVNGISNVYLYRLKNNENSIADVADYEPTPTTEFRIYYPSTGELVFTTLVRNWRASSYSSSDRMFDTPGYGHFYKLGFSMSTSSSYRVMLTNMKKLPANRMVKVDKEKEVKS